MDEVGFAQWVALLPCPSCARPRLLPVWGQCAGDRRIECSACGWTGATWAAEQTEVFRLVEGLGYTLPEQRRR